MLGRRFAQNIPMLTLPIMTNSTPIRKGNPPITGVETGVNNKAKLSVTIPSAKKIVGTEKTYSSFLKIIAVIRGVYYVYSKPTILLTEPLESIS